MTYKKGHPQYNTGRTHFKKGNIPWSKGTKGIKKANSGSFKKGESSPLKGKKNPKGSLAKMGKKNPMFGKKLSSKHLEYFKKGWGWSKGKHNYKIMGKLHHAWKGGVSSKNEKIRKSLEYKLWRKSVFIRDNFTCQKCEISGGRLVAHHINNFADFIELRLVISNGITLCKNCHIGFHKKFGKTNNTKEQICEFIGHYRQI